MRLRALALLPALLLPLAAPAGTIDDLVLVIRGHTIAFSLPSDVGVAPVGANFGEGIVSAATTIDGLAGNDIILYIFVVFNNIVATFPAATSPARASTSSSPD